MVGSVIEILIADDHPVVREGLRASLERAVDFAVVAEADHFDSVLEAAKIYSPDIILLDVNLPGGSGLDLAEKLKELCPESKVIMLTIHKTRQYVLRAIQAGASGYFLKDSHPKELDRAIRKVMQGGMCFSPGIEELVRDCWASSLREGVLLDHQALTQRETEVLVALARGLRNKEVADQLGLGIRTVETHRRHIMEKLGTQSLAGLVMYAISNGLISMEE